MSIETEGLKIRLKAYDNAITVLQADMAENITNDYVARVEAQLIISKIQAAHRDIATELADKEFDKEG